MKGNKTLFFFSLLLFFRGSIIPKLTIWLKRQWGRWSPSWWPRCELFLSPSAGAVAFEAPEQRQRLRSNCIDIAHAISLYRCIDRSVYLSISLSVCRYFRKCVGQTVQIRWGDALLFLLILHCESHHPLCNSVQYFVDLLEYLCTSTPYIYTEISVFLTSIGIVQYLFSCMCKI